MTKQQKSSQSSKFPGYTFLKEKSWTFNGIEMGYSEMSIAGSQTVQGKSEEEVVRLHFGLKGDYKYYDSQLDKSFDLIGGHHNIMYANPFEITVQNKTPEMSTFGVKFPKELFLQFVDQDEPYLSSFISHILEGKPVILSDQWGSLDSNLQQVLDQVIHNRYTGTLQNIFLLSKCLELLVLCIDNYQKVTDSYLYHAKKSDLEKIIAARDFINDSLDTPPNLSEISKIVGLNEYKLKRGFKAMYNQTIFNYMTDRRMGLALQYLTDSDKTAAEISFLLGYSSPQHFSTQFKNKYGHSPKSVRNNPDYVRNI